MLRTSKCRSSAAISWAVQDEINCTGVSTASRGRRKHDPPYAYREASDDTDRHKKFRVRVVPGLRLLKGAGDHVTH